MDSIKCKALKAKLTAEAEPHLVPIHLFFDGNDDPGSIGCNLLIHPGVAVFRDTLISLLRRADVSAVHARISEVDPGEKSWPYTDMILVAGTIRTADLRKAVSALQPDEVGLAEEFDSAAHLATEPDAQLLCIWWD